MPEKLTPHRKAEDFHFPSLSPLPSKVPFHSLWTLQMFYVRSINLGGREKVILRTLKSIEPAMGAPAPSGSLCGIYTPTPPSSLQESKPPIVTALQEEAWASARGHAHYSAVNMKKMSMRSTISYFKPTR